MENHFTVEGLHLIADAMVACTTLTSLVLKHNKIDTSFDAVRLLDACNKKRAKPATVRYT